VGDGKVSPAFEGRSFGQAGQYETLAGRAFGELDPDDPHNRLITDIRLAPRNANGRVEYVATFFLVKPIDMTKSSHLMWHDVPNRGGRITIQEAERLLGDVSLSSGWQGDNSGGTVPRPNNDYAVVPIARNADGSPVTGRVIGVVFTARDPYVLGIGYAAFRDVAAFFRHSARDGDGTANPVAQQISWVISLEERYRTHDGYVEAVRTAAAKAVREQFLLQPDADRLIAQAEASSVLRPQNQSR
jgi:hypothetical protein